VKVEVVEFPLTRVAMISHVGAPRDEHETARKLVAWKLELGLRNPLSHRSYGLHHFDPQAPRNYPHRVDFCLSIDENVAPNRFGIVESFIPAQRCARARDVGSREDNLAARWLALEWLPGSGERASGAPMIFHYVNVGPQLQPQDAITDVYLPLVDRVPNPV
jgi:AraC family transcriptional regulator